MDRAGREITLSAGQSAPVLRANREGGGVLTLLLYAADAEPPTDKDETDTPIFAVVAYGAGGAAIQVEVDVARGCVLSLPSGQIEVVAHYPIDPDAPAPFTPAQRVGAMVWEGARGGTAEPTRSHRLGLIPNGGSRIALVPPRAATVAVLPSELAAYSNCRVEFLRAPAGRLLARVEVQDHRPLLIPNGTRAIQLENRAGAASLYTLVFGLAL